MLGNKRCVDAAVSLVSAVAGVASEGVELFGDELSVSSIFGSDSPATDSRAAFKGAGNSLSRFAARRRMPAAALGLK